MYTKKSLILIEKLKFEKNYTDKMESFVRKDFYFIIIIIKLI